MFLFRQIGLEPAYETNYDNDRPWKSFENNLDTLKLFDLKTQHEVDTSNRIIEDGIWYDIEISSPNSYKYLWWSNPEYASKSFDADAIIRLAKVLSENFEHVNEENDFKSYKKNHWP